MQTLRDNGYIVNTSWHEDDIKHIAEEMEIELTNNQVKSIVSELEMLQSINYESIEVAIENA